MIVMFLELDPFSPIVRTTTWATGPLALDPLSPLDPPTTSERLDVDGAQASMPASTQRRNVSTRSSGHAPSQGIEPF